MKENRISKWKDAIDSKWSVCHTRCHLALNLWLHRNLFTFKTETSSAKTIWIVYLLRRESEEESGQEIGVNECKYSLDASWVCMCVCDLLLLVLNSRSKHKKQKQTDRETDNRSNTIERFDYVFNGGVDGYKLTDLWLFADWNSKVSICTYCHQTLNRGNRFVYIYAHFHHPKQLWAIVGYGIKRIEHCSICADESNSNSSLAPHDGFIFI